MLLVTILSCLACLVLGFKAAEYVYKCDALSDETEDELFENSDNEQK